MVRVSDRAIKESRVALRIDSTYVGSQTDGEVANLIHEFRKQLSTEKGVSHSNASEKALMVKALIPVKNEILENGGGTAMAFDVDTWASMLWDFYIAACNNTVAGQVCTALNDSEALWHDMVFDLLGEHKAVRKNVTGPWWSDRLAIMSMFFLMAIFGIALIALGDLSGRAQVTGAGASTSALVMGDLWRRYGPAKLFGTVEEEIEIISPGLPAVAPAPQQGGFEVVSLSSNSGKIQKENEELRRRLDALEKDPGKPVGKPTDDEPPLPPPEGMPPKTDELDALRGFASDAKIEGPISMTAAKHLQTAPPMASIDGGAKVMFPVGSVVTLHGFVEHDFLNGLQASVSSHAGDGRHHLLLADGSKVEYVKASNLMKWNGSDEKEEEARIVHQADMLASSSNEVHQGTPAQQNPLTQGKAHNLVATDILHQLEFWSSSAGYTPNWHFNLWKLVHHYEASGQLPASLKAILTGHGYNGALTRSPPRTVELKKQLKSFIESCSPSVGTGAQQIAGFIEGTVQDATADKLAAGAADDLNLWHSQLPPDHRFAGPEIYRSIRAAGHDSVRAYVNSFFSDDQRGSPEFLEWSTLASMIDFRLAKEPTATAVLAALASEDQLEIPLRKIASGVHLKRTGDREGAAAMLAISSRRGDDIAPTWLVAEAATYSTAEWKRKERAKHKPHGQQQQGYQGGQSSTGGGRGGRGAAPKGAGRGRGRGRGPKKPDGGGPNVTG